MRDEYDFTRARRGPVLRTAGKTRITIMLDDDVLAYFRERAESEGKGYQTLINAQLRASLPGAKGKDATAITLAGLRRVLREELRPLRR